MREIKRQFLKIMRLLKNKYVLIPFVGVLLMLALYTSYAFIRTELDWKTAGQIKFSNLAYTLKINNTATSTITSAANSGTVYYDVEITSLNETDTRYLLTYNSTVAGVGVKTSSKSINASSGTIGEYGNGSGTARSKAIRIAVINNTASAATITLEIRGGYTWNSAGSTKPRLGYKIINNLVYETALNNYLSLSEEVAEVLNCTPTSTLPCLYKENANNYITYSNHKWRMLGTYLINDEKVVKLILDDVLDTPKAYADVETALTTFYSTLDTSYIRQSSPFTCTGTSTISCTGSANIGLLSKSEYDLIYGENSYLYTLPEKNYWTNTASGSNYCVGTSRGINTQEATSTAYIKPVIYLKSNIINLAEQPEYTITNLIPNNNFSSGTTGWGTSGGTLSVSSGIATMSLDANWGRVGLGASISMNVGDVVYGKVKAKAPSTNYKFGLGTSIYGSYAYWSPSISFTSNTYTNTSGVFTIPSDITSSYFAIYNTNETAGTIYVDNTMLINLTATFGAGNEPSKEWCDENLDYFDGTITKKVKVGEYNLGTKINPYVANNNVFLEVKLNEGSTSQSFSEIYPQNSTLALTQPTRNKYQFIEWEVTGTGSSVSGNTLTIGTSNTTLTAKWALQEFEYIAPTSSHLNPYYEYVVPKSGWYEIEAWGAQGGSYVTNYGGKGAYVNGKVQLSQGDTLYIYVGSEGNVGSLGASVANSYNGGGGSDNAHANVRAASGGGATDVRYNGNNINDRIMVASGGGGDIYITLSYFSQKPNTLGGAGGELNGLNGENGYAAGYSNPTSNATGGTQISGGIGSNNTITYGGSFGQGGTGSNVASGGGGGYYGGGGGLDTGYTPAAGAGGSSYISGYAGVNAIVEGSASNPRSHTDNTKHYSGKYFVDGVMISGNKSMTSPNGTAETGHSGNGYARIKYLGSSAPIRINTKLNNVRYIKDCTTGNALDGHIRWDEIQAIDTNGLNVAFEKSIIDYTAAAYYPYSRITNGLVGIADMHAGTLIDEQGVNRCVTVDLGETYDLNEIVVWHMLSELYPAFQPYYNNYIQVSSDNTNWTTIRESESVSEDSTGKRTSAFKLDYGYTGGQQSYTIPISGKYKLEVWGAQGGGNSTYYGGKGGYSIGYTQLSAGEILFINVGGKGNYCTGASCTLAGGYNGGGSCRSHSDISDSTCGSGGGATHIAKESGILSSLSSQVSSILLVAGGGGGGNLCNSCCNYGAGGAGGGLTGGAAVNIGAPYFTQNGGTTAVGGTQTIGAAFGQGTSSSSATTAQVGGGGGYWGGIGSNINGAGGGSGYIGGVTNGSTTAGQRNDNGYARITYIGD